MPPRLFPIALPFMKSLFFWIFSLEHHANFCFTRLVILEGIMWTEHKLTMAPNLCHTYTAISDIN